MILARVFNIEAAAPCLGGLWDLITLRYRKIQGRGMDFLLRDLVVKMLGSMYCGGTVSPYMAGNAQIISLVEVHGLVTE